MNKKNFRRQAAALLLAAMSLTAHAQQTQFLNNNHCIYRISTPGKYLLMPVQEKAEMCNVAVIDKNNRVKTLNVRLAANHVDYYVPLKIEEFDDRNSLALDIHINGSYRNDGELAGFTCWKKMKTADTFDTANREQYRPVYHHTPAYGWMNDPNGMFFKDGVWHIYFQHNPYGSQWENMTWGHSTSTDLLHWTFEGDAIEPDNWGTVFSGSAVVDKEGTAGFGKDAVVALYTSAGENQTQSLAYSNDDGKTFTKYNGNPIITSNVPDFRDPHVFWNDEIKKWNMILAAGQQMNIYSSDNLRDWTLESSFGAGYGSHDGVWECPDLMKLHVRGTDKEKWLLICNINPGRTVRRLSHTILRRFVRRQEIHLRDRSRSDEMDGLRKGPLRHRQLRQRSRRTPCGPGLDEQLAVCQPSAHNAVPLRQLHSTRPRPLRV